MDPPAIGILLRQHLISDFLREACRLHSYARFGSTFDWILWSTKGQPRPATFALNREDHQMKNSNKPAHKTAGCAPV